MTSIAERTVVGPSPNARNVAVWLFCLAALVLAMVTLGGLTRLTGSGLSITEWRPMTGVVPPLSAQAWSAEFEKYRHIPQYVRENSWMTLTDFKTIYWWEWTHRMLGRLVGVAFIVPFLWFAWTGAIARSDWPRMFSLFLLGGLQGLVGWWMVESGLEVRVAVSQYRLAVHLGTALLLLGALLWVGLEYLRRQEKGAAPHIESAAPLASASFALVAIVYLQMLLGAFVAGLHAGLIYNTWPSMNGRVLPEGAFFVRPWWRNFFENPGLAQFDHRMGAYIVLASAVALWWRLRQATPRLRRSSTALLHLSLVQVALGIATLLMQAPLALSALHQLVAALLFCGAVWNAFEARQAAIA